MIEAKDNYTKEEVLEIIRQVLYLGDPEFYEGGGVLGGINFPHKGTYARALECFERYYLKIPKKKVEE